MRSKTEYCSVAVIDFFQFDVGFEVKEPNSASGPEKLF